MHCRCYFITVQLNIIPRLSLLGQLVIADCISYARAQVTSLHSKRMYQRQTERERAPLEQPFRFFLIFMFFFVVVRLLFAFEPSHGHRNWMLSHIYLSNYFYYILTRLCVVREIHHSPTETKRIAITRPKIHIRNAYESRMASAGFVQHKVQHTMNAERSRCCGRWCCCFWGCMSTITMKIGYLRFHCHAHTHTHSLTFTIVHTSSHSNRIWCLFYATLSILFISSLCMRCTFIYGKWVQTLDLRVRSWPMIPNNRRRQRRRHRKKHA